MGGTPATYVEDPLLVFTYCDRELKFGVKLDTS